MVVDCRRRHIILPTTIIHPPPWYYRFLMNEEAICSNDESMMWCISRVLYGYNEALYFLFDVSKRKQKLLKVQRILSSFPEHVFIGWWRSLEVHAAPKNGSRMMIGLRLWTRSFPYISWTVFPLILCIHSRMAMTFCKNKTTFSKTGYTINRRIPPIA